MRTNFLSSAQTWIAFDVLKTIPRYSSFVAIGIISVISRLRRSTNEIEVVPDDLISTEKLRVTVAYMTRGPPRLHSARVKSYGNGAVTDSVPR